MEKRRGRDGGLKMDWSKPLHHFRRMCFDCDLEREQESEAGPVELSLDRRRQPRRLWAGSQRVGQ